MHPSGEGLNTDATDYNLLLLKASPSMLIRSVVIESAVIDGSGLREYQESALLFFRSILKIFIRYGF